jgi:tRNA modification GTPase
MSAEAHTAAHVVHVTPPGRGAIATLLVEGPGATECVKAHFRPARGGTISDHAVNEILVGHWGGAEGEPLVVCRRGPERIEVHCHGGSAAVDRTVKSLIQTGCRHVAWPEWSTARADDPLQAQAQRGLAEARTLRTAAILLDQYLGALRRALREVETVIGRGDLVRASERLRSLLAHADVGRHLTKPWRAVLAGRPNVGKSSLLNALLGYRRAVVFRQPGTTRDVVTAPTALNGWPVELADTAGFRSGDGLVERAAIGRAADQLAAADLVVWVVDGTWRSAPDEHPTQRAWPNVLCVYNKWDLVGRHRAAASGLVTSAVTGDGIDRLAAAITARLVPNPPPRGAPVPFCRDHVESIEATLAAIAAGDCRAALARLRAIAGRPNEVA